MNRRIMEIYYRSSSSCTFLVEFLPSGVPHRVPEWLMWTMCSIMEGASASSRWPVASSMRDATCKEHGRSDAEADDHVSLDRVSLR